MTIVLSHKEYQGLDGLTWFVEKYQEKFSKQSFWRYGIIVDGKAYLRRDLLWSKPNLKKLKII